LVEFKAWQDGAARSVYGCGSVLFVSVSSDVFGGVVCFAFQVCVRRNFDAQCGKRFAFVLEGVRVKKTNIHI
jgi:hypothetical protein